MYSSGPMIQDSGSTYTIMTFVTDPLLLRDFYKSLIWRQGWEEFSQTDRVWKKIKVNDKNMFNDIWIEKYAFILHFESNRCLICSVSVALVQRANMKHQYETQRNHFKLMRLIYWRNHYWLSIKKVIVVNYAQSWTFTNVNV